MSDISIEDLITLASIKTSSSRARLAENITDLFLKEGDRLSEHERALMSDILTKLLGQVERNVRAELAQALQISGAELPDVVKMLANDDIDIARPLLEKSKLLKDPDLIEIVQMRTDEHRMAITLREAVSPQLSDAIVEYGNEDAIESLLSNHDSQLSARAMEYLVAESRRVDRFQEPLLQRSDLPSELAYKMYWWVSAALRKQILAEHEIDPSLLERALQRATKSVLVDFNNEQGTYIKAQRLVRRMNENGELTFQFLLGCLRGQRIAVFIAGTAELAGISFATAWRIFNDRGGESFAIIAKAIGMDRNLFTNLFLLVVEAREGPGAKSPSVLKHILALFDDVSEEKARGALLVWQRDSAYQAAVEELERNEYVA